jgi:hypothetical protein
MTERLRVMSAREELEMLNRESPCLDGSIHELYPEENEGKQ